MSKAQIKSLFLSSGGKGTNFNQSFKFLKRSEVITVKKPAAAKMAYKNGLLSVMLWLKG
jgi:dihydrodipicolinate reductase